MFAPTGYPSKFHGKLISGKCARANSNVTQKNGAAIQASVLFARGDAIYAPRKAAN